MEYPEAGSAKGISAPASTGREDSDSLQDVLEGRVAGFQDTFVFSWMTILLVCSEDLYSS